MFCTGLVDELSPHCNCLQVYMASLSKLYSREVTDFIETAKQKLVTTKDSKGKLGMLSCFADLMLALFERLW